VGFQSIADRYTYIPSLGLGVALVWMVGGRGLDRRWWAVLSGLVGTSRIFLGRHTPMQVYAGFILGFFCTFTASILSYIYLFI
jgi:membrane-associated phospholipid phosphatase